MTMNRIQVPNLAASPGRRNFLASAGAAAGVLLLPAARGIAAPSAPGFRFVHLTDLHIQPELMAAEGVKACLAAVEALAPRPDFILTGGDLVMDAFEQDEARAKSLFGLYGKVLADNTSLPVHNCLGNHDVFGWSHKKGIGPEHALYGKKMAAEALGLEKTWHAFDHKGWRFYVLDSIQPAGRGYEGGIDPEQMEWLEGDLKAKPAATPAVVVTHIPILTVTVIRDSERGFQGTEYRISASGMCRGAEKLSRLFAAHNVKLALSGHIHERDRIDFLGTAYICDGAVCGGWWKGPNAGVQEGFGVIDLGPDGLAAHQYHDYGWTEAKG